MSALAENPWLFGGLAGVLGLLIGSFLNVVIYRLPRMMQRQWAIDATQILAEPEVRAELQLPSDVARAVDSSLSALGAALQKLPALGIATPRSRCPSCGHPISALENIPVLSWISLKGRCRACKARISARYPLVEAAVGGLFALAALQFGATPQAAASLVLIGLCVAMTLIDADTLLLPDVLTLPLLWIGILIAAAGWGFATLPASVLGAAGGYAAFWSIGTLFRVVRGIEGMGAGDYKLLAALGAWFGWSALLPIVLLSAGVGSIVGVGLMLAGRATALSRLPFGVYLAPAGIIMLFFGPRLVALVLPGVH
jgi:leader peptidase (prepilin peptidase)/N-methyltransferase